MINIRATTNTSPPTTRVTANLPHTLGTTPISNASPTLDHTPSPHIQQNNKSISHENYTKIQTARTNAELTQELLALCVDQSGTYSPTTSQKTLPYESIDKADQQRPSPKLAGSSPSYSLSNQPTGASNHSLTASLKHPSLANTDKTEQPESLPHTKNLSPYHSLNSQPNSISSPQPTSIDSFSACSSFKSPISSPLHSLNYHLSPQKSQPSSLSNSNSLTSNSDSHFAHVIPFSRQSSSSGYSNFSTPPSSLSSQPDHIHSTQQLLIQQPPQQSDDNYLTSLCLNHAYGITKASPFTAWLSNLKLVISESRNGEQLKVPLPYDYKITPYPRDADVKLTAKQLSLFAVDRRNWMVNISVPTNIKQLLDILFVNSKISTSSTEPFTACLDISDNVHLLFGKQLGFVEQNHIHLTTMIDLVIIEAFITKINHHFSKALFNSCHYGSEKPVGKLFYTSDRNGNFLFKQLPTYKEVAQILQEVQSYQSLQPYVSPITPKHRKEAVIASIHIPKRLYLAQVKTLHQIHILIAQSIGFHHRIKNSVASISIVDTIPKDITAIVQYKLLSGSLIITKPSYLQLPHYLIDTTQSLSDMTDIEIQSAIQDITAHAPNYYLTSYSDSDYITRFTSRRLLVENLPLAVKLNTKCLSPFPQTNLFNAISSLEHLHLMNTTDFTEALLSHSIRDLSIWAHFVIHSTNEISCPVSQVGIKSFLNKAKLICESLTSNSPKLETLGNTLDPTSINCLDILFFRRNDSYSTNCKQLLGSLLKRIELLSSDKNEDHMELRSILNLPCHNPHMLSTAYDNTLANAVLLQILETFAHNFYINANYYPASSKISPLQMPKALQLDARHCILFPVHFGELNFIHKLISCVLPITPYQVSFSQYSNHLNSQHNPFDLAIRDLSIHEGVVKNTLLSTQRAYIMEQRLMQFEALQHVERYLLDEEHTFSVNATLIQPSDLCKANKIVLYDQWCLSPYAIHQPKQLITTTSATSMFPNKTFTWGANLDQFNPTTGCIEPVCDLASYGYPDDYMHLIPTKDNNPYISFVAYYLLNFIFFTLSDTGKPIKNVETFVKEFEVFLRKQDKLRQHLAQRKLPLSTSGKSLSTFYDKSSSYAPEQFIALLYNTRQTAFDQLKFHQITIPDTIER